MCLKVPASRRPWGVAGMLKYLKKFAVDILPSVAATVIGAYIVNHYIVTKPGADAPAAAAVSTAEPKAEGKAEAKHPTPSRPRPWPVGNLPAAGRQGQGHLREGHHGKDRCRTAGGGRKGPATKQRLKRKLKPKPTRQVAEPSPPEIGRSPPTPSRAVTRPRRAKGEKIRVMLPSPVQPVASPVAPAPAARRAAVAAPVEPHGRAGGAPRRQRSGARRDRAAARQRRSVRPRTPESRPARHEAPVAMRRSSRRRLLPRPRFGRCRRRSWCRLAGRRTPGQAPSQPRPPYARGSSDPHRPTPPADIPVSRPLDLRAEVAEPSVRERARRPPKTCCRRRSRCSTPSCRNSSGAASRRCARARCARRRPWGGARARGRRRRTPWPCRRAAHR